MKNKSVSPVFFDEEGKTMYVKEDGVRKDLIILSSAPLIVASQKLKNNNEN